ncbi:creatininase family protein [bacterium]|nr:creatininase family protein [bacterium]
MSKDKKKVGFPIMEEMTVKTVREYLTKNNSIILPIGIIEQHGYHLPLITDALMAREVGRLVAEKMNILMAPVFYTSFSGGSLPGTINISPSVTALVISDILISLASQGFKKIYIFLGHGGGENLKVIDISVKLLLKSNPIFSDVMVSMFPVWSFDESGKGWKQAVKDQDWHAGWLETSMMLAVAPHLVRMEEMERDTDAVRKMQLKGWYAEKIVDEDVVIPRTISHPKVKVGVIGNPKKASEKLGKEVVNEAVRLIIDKIKKLEKKYDGKYKKVELKQT